MLKKGTLFGIGDLPPSQPRFVGGRVLIDNAMLGCENVTESYRTSAVEYLFGPDSMTTFRQLNAGWNAEPNAPDPRVAVEGQDVVVMFLMNSFQFPQFTPEDVGRLRFISCQRYRLGPTNDEGWYRGQCRFSKAAPRWGEFYEVGGDLRLAECSNDWVEIGPAENNSRHFLFYFRDETFECDASDWRFEVLKAEPIGAANGRRPFRSE